MTPLSLPVWADVSEFECCSPEAVVGERWSGPCLIHPGHRRLSEHPDVLTTEQAELGVFSSEVEVIQPAINAEEPALVLVQGIRLAVIGLQSLGHQVVKGRLVLDRHCDPEGIAFEDTVCEGTVRRVRRVPVTHQLRGEQGWVPISQGHPVDVQSTAERPVPSESDMTVTEFFDFLIDLDVGAKA